jgi:hypothetical protein
MSPKTLTENNPWTKTKEHQSVGFRRHRMAEKITINVVTTLMLTVSFFKPRVVKVCAANHVPCHMATKGSENRPIPTVAPRKYAGAKYEFCPGGKRHIK